MLIYIQLYVIDPRTSRSLPLE